MKSAQMPRISTKLRCSLDSGTGETHQLWGNVRINWIVIEAIRGRFYEDARSRPNARSLVTLRSTLEAGLFMAGFCLPEVDRSLA